MKILKFLLILNLVFIFEIFAKKTDFVVDNLIGVTFNQNGQAIVITEKNVVKAEVNNLVEIYQTSEGFKIKDYLSNKIDELIIMALNNQN